MFARNLFRRLLHTNIGFGLDAVPKKAYSLDFGDPRMPDKLYKMVELEMKSADPVVVKSYIQFILTAAEHLNITVLKVFSNKKPSFKRFTVLKSAFVHRKHLVQYEIRTYYSWVQFAKLTGSTADTFLEYVERMLPEGVALKVTRVAIEPKPEHLNHEKIAQSANKVQNLQTDESPENDEVKEAK